MVLLAETYMYYMKNMSKARLNTRAVTILHELSHMWFGDLVTMYY